MRRLRRDWPASLGRLAEDLPALAGVEAGDRFVTELLGRTTGRRRPVERWAARLAAGWGEMLRRPRFAWEAAYVATFVAALLFTTPGSPLAGVPRTALDLAEARPLAQLREPVARLEEPGLVGEPRGSGASRASGRPRRSTRPHGARAGSHAAWAKRSTTAWEPCPSGLRQCRRRKTTTGSGDDDDRGQGEGR